MAPSSGPSLARSGRALLREPLAHFFLAGAVLFGLDRAMSRSRRAGDAGASGQAAAAGEVAAAACSSSAPASPLVVDEALRRRHAARVAETTGKQPGEKELGEALEAWLDEESLYREGLRLGLEREDPVVRQRVVAKTRAVLLAQALLPEPTEAELVAHHAAHRERWDKPALVDFVHVFVKGHDAAASERAAKLLATLQAGGEPDGQGDTFPGGRRYRQRPLGELGQAFGEAFVAGMAEAPLGAWSLRPSRFGLHLVRIDRRTQAERPPFASVRDDVAADLHVERRDAALAAAVRELRARHTARSGP